MILEVKDLHKSFGENEILHGISFSVESGKALGLLGRNGAGKTTTIRIIMDVFKANSGEVLLDGKPFKSMENRIGYLPEERGMYAKKKVVEQMVYFAGLRGMNTSEAKKSALKWLKRLGIEEYANRKLETLSKGNQQKVQLAQTLVCNPDIIILDEPFSGLDPVNSQILKDVVTELIEDNKLVIFSSHQMGYVEEFCEDIVIINHGSIVLDGNLKVIKKEFGRGRFILSAENYGLGELKTIIEKEYSDIMAINSVKKEFIVLEPVNGCDKKTVLQRLSASGIDVRSFGSYEPTLNDIFVERAGDN